MQVFKAYFILLKKYIGTIFLFFAIFLVISLIMSSVMSSDGEVAFSAEKLDIAILDKDGKTFAKALENYFGENHNLVETEEDKKEILDALYWRKLDYVLVIPEGFEESLTAEGREAIELQCMRIPGYFDATYFEAELQLYTSKLTGLLAAGYSMEEAQKELVKLRNEESNVQVASFVNGNQHDACTNFFGYVPYLFISVGIVGVGMILLRLNEKEVKDRTECSSTPMKERIAGAAAGILLFGMSIYLFVILVGVFLSEGRILTDIRMPYFMLNMFAMLLFGLSLGFLTGMIAKNSDTVNGIVNTLSLALCFLGGIFVPQEFFGEGVRRVAQLLPTYWYVVTNEEVGGMIRMTPVLSKQIMAQTGLIFCYSLAIFAITLVIISGKRKRTA